MDKTSEGPHFITGEDLCHWFCINVDDIVCIEEVFCSSAHGRTKLQVRLRDGRVISINGEDGMKAVRNGMESFSVTNNGRALSETV